MKLVVFGLSVSSSWGNGHATLWRALIAALVHRGHQVVFFERDVPYYADHRDLTALPGGELRLYGRWDDVLPAARAHLADADAAIVTSYCADGFAATDLVLDSAVPCRVFYDLDTPVTLDALERHGGVEYLGPRGLGEFDLVLSYTGGRALDALRERLGARRVAPLYGSVDPEVHRPALALDRFRSDLSYIGTFAEDRQTALEALFVEPARRRPDQRFVLAGSKYPPAFPWTDNIFFVHHLPPGDHPAFYASSRLTLNVTRRPMADMGWCPSGRLFEAAACRAPILTDAWEGLEAFYEPGEEILVAEGTDEALGALSLGDAELARIASRARERTLEEHTADRRAEELEALLGAGVAQEG